ncbi:GntR family transcriptional regulator [Bordetella genomosp. 13]|uniref:HTH gntR-type domain-containing protein n=1 Tax=Bordetella genomosp. 13 TaxID=463040 RepID=A0A1W6ZFR7_9BORD|nr:GntR family transcriptional regulator [Bordetella genomosp. 13]ARP96105.1 hypothetical protein CAL15_18025 [Bordetella genomosp. 13]
MLKTPQSRSTSSPRPAKSTASRSTLADEVRVRITEEIVTGAYAPGARLDENSLAQKFDVSRTPVREALRQLVASGLVEWRPRQGAVVAQASVQQLVEMFEMMAELESFAGRLASRRMTEAERTQLQELLDKARGSVSEGNRNAYQKHNRAFHFAIYKGSHNHCLIGQACALYDRIAPYRAYELSREGEVGRVFEEHEAITRAIVQRDGVRAAHLLKEHAMPDMDLLGDLIATSGH